MRTHHKQITILLLSLLTLLACNLPRAAAPTSTSPAAADPTVAEAVPAPTSTTEPASEEPPPENTASPPDPVPQTVLPEGPITLITLGDSLTEGMGDDELGTGYPGRLLEMLQALRPGSTLFNFGVSGWNTDYLINGGDGFPSQLEPALAEIHRARDAGEPALALVWIGNNDLWYLYEYGPDPITEEAESFDLDNYTRNITHILTELQDAGAVVLVGLNDDQSLRPFLTNPPGDPVLPYTTPDDLQRMSLQVQAYNAAITTAAAGLGIGVVDFYNTDIFTNPETLAEDGIHPNPHGYQIIADLWMEAILNLLP